MRWLALCLALPGAALAQDRGAVRACVEALDGADVASCRGAYITPCLDAQPAYPMQCHQAALHLWAEQIRREASALLDRAEDAAVSAPDRAAAYETWRAAHRTIQENEEACAELRFVDMVDETFPNADYFACVIDGHEAALTGVRRALEVEP